MEGIFAEKFKTLVARIGDMKMYEYDLAGLYLVRNDKNGGAWLFSSFEKAMLFIYKVRRY